MTCEVISKQDVRKPQYSCLEYCSDFPSGLLELNFAPQSWPKGPAQEEGQDPSSVPMAPSHAEGSQGPQKP